VGDTAKLKKAIAILAYNNAEYFCQVLDAVLEQTIDGQPIDQHYDIFIYQDGLQQRHAQASLVHYERIAQYAEQKLGHQHFFRQASNIGIGLQFAFVEQDLFINRQYDFVTFLEHDYVVGPQYFEVLTKLAMLFEADERIAAVSANSSQYRARLEQQIAHQNELIVMEHDWGAGVFRRAWEKRLPVMNAYYRLLQGSAFEDRPNLLIQSWMSSLGFYPGSTSQDTIKACVDSALGQVRISTYPNFGRYIGAQGMHWNQEIYEQHGYDKTVIFSEKYTLPIMLSAQSLNQLLVQQKSSFLEKAESFDELAFLDRIARDDLDFVGLANLKVSHLTHEDVKAAYLIFLGRLPRDQDEIDNLLGKSGDDALSYFLLSDEFTSRSVIAPIIFNCAKKILDKQQAAAKKI